MYKDKSRQRRAPREKKGSKVETHELKSCMSTWKNRDKTHTNKWNQDPPSCSPWWFVANLCCSKVLWFFYIFFSGRRHSEFSHSKLPNSTRVWRSHPIKINPGELCMSTTRCRIRHVTLADSRPRTRDGAQTPSAGSIDVWPLLGSFPLIFPIIVEVWEK